MKRTIFKSWLEQSTENQILFAQEDLIHAVTEELWEALHQKNWSLSDLARKMGTTRANLSAILSGRRNLTLKTLSDCAFALDLSPVLTFTPKSGTKRKGEVIRLPLTKKTSPGRSRSIKRA